MRLNTEKLLKLNWKFRGTGINAHITDEPICELCSKMVNALHPIKIRVGHCYICFECYNNIMLKSGL